MTSTPGDAAPSGQPGGLSIGSITAGLLAPALSAQVTMVLRGLPQKCWRCGADAMAIGLLHPLPEGGEISDPVSYDSVTWADQGLGLAYAAALLRAHRHPAAAAIKPRRSKSLEETYLSNGCPSCDVIFGAYFVGEELLAWCHDRIHQLPALLRVGRPVLDLYVLQGHASWAVDD